MTEHGKRDKLDYEALETIYKDEQEVRSMLVTAVEKERKALYERGVEEGIRGEKLETARNLLTRGFELKLISEITGLSIQEIEEIKSANGPHNNH